MIQNEHFLATLREYEGKFKIYPKRKWAFHQTHPECHGTEFVDFPRSSGETLRQGPWSGRDPYTVCKGSMRTKCLNLSVPERVYMG